MPSHILEQRAQTLLWNRGLFILESSNSTDDFGVRKNYTLTILINKQSYIVEEIAVAIFSKQKISKHEPEDNTGRPLSV